MVTRNNLNTYITPDTNNQVLMPSQSAFFAITVAKDLNITGDSTQFYLGDTDVGTALSEIFDQNSDFTAGASGGAYFTAPVTGRYIVGGSIYAEGHDGTQTRVQIDLITSNRTYRLLDANPTNVRNSNNFLEKQGAFLCDMDAADTAKLRIIETGGNKSIDIGSATTRLTNFGGYLAV